MPSAHSAARRTRIRVLGRQPGGRGTRNPATTTEFDGINYYTNVDKLCNNSDDDGDHHHHHHHLLTSGSSRRRSRCSRSSSSSSSSSCCCCCSSSSSSSSSTTPPPPAAAATAAALPPLPATAATTATSTTTTTTAKCHRDTQCQDTAARMQHSGTNSKTGTSSANTNHVRPNQIDIPTICRSRSYVTREVGVHDWTRACLRETRSMHPRPYPKP